MSQSFSTILGQIAGEFTDRQQRGETPTIEEYANLYPHMADLLRDVLPLVVAVAPLSTMTGSSGMSPPSDPLSSPPGYELLQELGRGGMGVVFRARQTALQRDTALKMILPGYRVGPDELTRFTQEARAIATLQHVGIVSIFEIGEHAGRPFFSLELCEGGSLADQLTGGPLSPVDAGRVVQNLADAVQVAHDAGIIHRDLKPANVLRTRDGTYKVTDFGLIKRTEVPSELSQSGMVIGTPSYMPPEQARGSAGIDHRADVYSLGAILYECLTGRPPFRAASVFDTLSQVLHTDPVPPARLNQKVPADLDTICMKCLQKDPARRYGSARELREDLDRFLTGRPIQARPVSTWEVAMKWAGRNRALASLMTASVVGTLCALGIFVWLWVSAEESAKAARNSADQEKTAKQTAQAAEKEATASAQLARDNLYLRNISLSDPLIREGNVLQAERLLSECPVQMRGWEWRHLWERIRGLDAEILLHYLASCKAVALSPDGKMLAAGSSREITLMDPVNRRIIRTIHHKNSEQFVSIAFSPDGRTIACVSTFDQNAFIQSNRLHLYNVADGKLLRTTNGLNAVAYRQDGWLATGNGGEVLLYDPVVGKRRATLQGYNGTIQTVAFNRAGDLLACGTANGDVYLHRQDGGGMFCGVASLMGLAGSSSGRLLAPSALLVRNILPYGPAVCISAHDSTVHRVAFDPGGQRLASGSSDQFVRIWDCKTGSRLSEMIARDGWITSLAWTSKGDRLISAGHGGIVHVWDPTTGQEMEQFVGHTGPIFDLCCDSGNTIYSASMDTTLRRWTFGRHPGIRQFSLPDDGAIHVALAGEDRAVSLSRKGVVHIWDLKSGIYQVLGQHSGMLARLAVNSRGTIAASMNLTGGVMLWDLKGKKPPLSLPTPTNLGAALGLCLSSDGSLCATGHTGGKVILWDTQTGKEKRSWKVPGAISIMGLSFGPGDETLTSSSMKGIVTAWNLSDGKELYSIRTRQVTVNLLRRPGREQFGIAGATPQLKGLIALISAKNGSILRSYVGHNSVAASMSFTPDGRFLVTGTATEGRITLWNPDEGRSLIRLGAGFQGIYSLAFDSQGRRLISSGTDGIIRLYEGPLSPQRFVLREQVPLTALEGDFEKNLWVTGDLVGNLIVRDLQTGRPRGQLNQNRSITDIALDPTGEILAVGSNESDIQLHSTHDAKHITTLKTNEGQAWTVAWASSRLVAGGTFKGGVYLWSLPEVLTDSIPEPKLLGRHSGPVRKVAFNKDGTLLASAGREGVIRLWDTATGKELRILQGAKNFARVAFHPREDRLIALSNTGTLYQWDKAGNLLYQKPIGEGLTTDDFALSPDGKHLVVAARNRRIYLCDTATGQVRRELLGHTHEVKSLRWLTKDLVLSAGYDATSRLWEVGDLGS